MQSDEDVEEDNKALFEFLEMRNVDTEILKKEKINRDVLTAMSEKEMARFIPIYGDRIALRVYLQKEEGKRKKSKKTLYASLRHKFKGIKKTKPKANEIKQPESSDDEPTCNDNNPYIGNRNALKGSRIVHFCLKRAVNDKKYVTVRTRRGGGPRDVSVPKSSKKSDLIDEAKKTYFTPDSKLGSVSDYTYNIQNYMEEELNDTSTVGQLYATTGIPKLTYYFLIKPVQPVEMDLSEIGPKTEIETPDASTPTQNFDDISAVVQGSDDLLSEAIKVADIPIGDYTLFDVLDCDVESDRELGPEHAQGCHNSSQSKQLLVMNPNAEIPTTETNTAETEIPTTETNTADTEIPTTETNTADTEIPTTETNTADGQMPNANYLEAEDLLIRKERIHRVNLLDEMITLFKRESIMLESLSFEYINECGSDLNGVSRDVYASFWIEFFRRASEGEESRVPALNAKWQAEEWRSIGRILGKGFQDQGVFPVQLSPVTATILAFGEDAVCQRQLQDSFLSYVSKSERDLLEAAFKNKLTEEEKDEFLELLDRFGCTSLPTNENLHKLIDQIAHKELVQKAKYATDSMALTCRDALLSRFNTVDELVMFFRELDPTPRKVIKLLDVTTKTSAESLALRYLQQYIRGQNSLMLRKLLRFLTGSENITVRKIEINFTQLEGFARRPVAHTCGPLLELPSTYNSYPELRNEFDSILSDDSCFAMNIV